MRRALAGLLRRVARRIDPPRRTVWSVEGNSDPVAVGRAIADQLARYERAGGCRRA